MASQTARISLPERKDMTDQQQLVLDDIVGGQRGEIVGPLRAAIHNPELADAWQKLGAVLRYKTVFDPIYSELAILLTARRWNCELEWVIHQEAAEKAGMSDEVIKAIRENLLPNFEDPKLSLVHNFISQLQNSGQVDDYIHSQITKVWGAVGVVELTALTGYYSMVAMTLNAHQISLPKDRKARLYPNKEAPATTLSELPYTQ